MLSTSVSSSLLSLCSSVTAVRLPDSLSFVVYEFWDGEEEWKRWVFNHIQLKREHFNLKPTLLADICPSCGSKSFLISSDLFEQDFREVLMHLK